MKCLRCGYCCHMLAVIIVNDPKKGIAGGNLTLHKGMKKPCQHLVQDGERYFCLVHDEPWYSETPCAMHGQIESSPDAPCRIGKAIMSGKLERIWRIGKE